jgi:hypothetical protein
MKRFASILVLLAACGGGAGNSDTDTDGDPAPDAGAAPDGSGDPDASATHLPPCAVAAVEPGCLHGPGDMPGSTCQTLTITCEGADDIDVTLLTTEPAGEVRGTVILGSGGGGRSLSYDGTPIAQALLAEGFRLVQRAWSIDWTAGVQGRGLVLASARYATLARWLRDEVAGEGALCATANSGGAAELGQALTRWSLDEVLDQAVPTSGPGMARLDLGCAPDDAWLAECAALAEASEVSPACTYAEHDLDELIDQAYAPATPCGDGALASRDQLLADSSLADAADVEISQMRLDVLLGTRDGMASFVEGRLFADGIVAGPGGQVFVEITLGAPHGYPSEDPGLGVLIERLVEGCVPRHAPA